MTLSTWLQQRRSLIFLLILLVVILPFLFQIVRPFIIPFTIAIIIATIMNPVQEWLNRKLHRRVAATLLTTLITVAVLGTVLTVVGFTLTTEITSLYKEFSESSLQEGGWPAMATTTADKIVDKLSSRLPIDKAAIREELLKFLKKVSEYLFSNIGLAVSGITHLLFAGLLVTIFLYFLLKHGRDWIQKLAILTPLDRRAADNILTTIHNSVVANVNGMLAVVIGQSVLLILGFWFTGVRSPLLWGMLGGLASIVPVIGALLIWAPVVIGFVFMGLYWKATILCLWCILAVGSADNILRSIVVGKYDKQHPILVALAVIGGTYSFGVMGILLGPLILSLASALWQEIHQLNASNHDPENHIGEVVQTDKLEESPL
jgi:predicted PurR-regulated permease PerM